jgi:hypothetical protein
MMTVQGVNTVIELEDFEVDFILKFIIFTKRQDLEWIGELFPLRKIIRNCQLRK